MRCQACGRWKGRTIRQEGVRALASHTELLWTGEEHLCAKCWAWYRWVVREFNDTSGVPTLFGAMYMGRMV